jgi:hypothetical protein
MPRRDDFFCTLAALVLGASFNAVARGGRAAEVVVFAFSAVLGAVFRVAFLVDLWVTFGWVFRDACLGV